MGEREKELRRPFWPRYLNRLSLPIATHDSEDTLASDTWSHTFKMLSYLIKPVEPTILNHKGYHELSSTDLLPSLVVRPPLPKYMSKATLTPGLVEQLSTMHVVPELLDVKRFNIALAEALSSFPLLAGRLVRPDRPDAPWAVCPCFLSSSPRTNHGI